MLSSRTRASRGSPAESSSRSCAAGVPSRWNTTCARLCPSVTGRAPGAGYCVQKKPALPALQATSPPAAADATRAIASGSAWPVARSITRTVPPASPPDSATATRRPSSDGRKKSIATVPSGAASFGSNTTRSLARSSTERSITRTGRCCGGAAFSAKTTPPRSTSAL